ncbi:MAG: FG-GAP-like repeat-containing protein [Acidobacteriaceae bacterium]
MIAMLVTGCHSGLPSTSAAAYTQFVSSFYVGLAAMEVGNDVRAEDQLQRATQLAPDEPATWADWGILALRQRNFVPAQQRLEQAHKLAPKDSRIEADLGVLASTEGDSGQAVTDLRKAVALDPRNVRALYLLAQEVEREAAPHSDQEFQQLIEKVLEARPNNIPALLELTRIAAKRGDTATVRSTVARIAAQSRLWPAQAQQQLAVLQQAAQSAPATAALRSLFLRNMLLPVPSFRAQLAEIKAQPGQEAQPFSRFLRLPNPSSQPAPPDMGMRFVDQPIGNVRGPWKWIGAVWLGNGSAPVIAMANAKTVTLSSGPSFPFPSGATHVLPGPDSVLPVDFNHDFRTDLVLAGAGGVRFLRQDSPDRFTDVTAQTKLPKAILSGEYTGAWAVDIDADGDMDIVMGSTSGLPTVLRNNSDGTFTPIHPFAGISGIRQFVWADLEGDGDPDAALIDGAGRLHVFHNDHSGNFSEVLLPAEIGEVKATAAGDVQDRGSLDLLAVEQDGAIVRIADDPGGWTAIKIAQVPDAGQWLAGEVRLISADLDNSGAVDLMLSPVEEGEAAQGALIWLGGANGQLTLMHGTQGPAKVFAAADLDGAGRLDLLGLDRDGQAEEGVSRGTKNYHWQVIRPRAVQANGAQRINSFGVGGTVQIRAGLLLQAQPIAGPEVHFGLGTWTETNVARVLWPNGVVNAEFALKDDAVAVAEQRLKGSCPFLYAWDGKEFRFVKDVGPWGAALGMRIDGQGSARVATTREWYKIPRQDLAARDGSYDLRITDELWETYYYDWLKLMTVDHPPGTDVFVDERFVVPPVKLTITVTGMPHPIARAVDDRGNDVTEALRSPDGRYLHSFGRGQYQGVTRDHYVEIDLGPNIPTRGPLYLIARGWLHPADSSINMALSQGHHEQPKPMSLQIPNGHGGWVTVQPNLGMPAGRNKICLINLTGLFRPGIPHKVRLWTNLEIYWDQIQWARGLPNTPIKVTWLTPSYANLRYRGYSVIHQANWWSPEIPDYEQLASTTQIWRDLAGYYTRYGDVRPLLAKVDDRYVIMNAGDELALRFPASPPPPTGWVRDYVIASDGWVKDGDFNSVNSATVRPLPYHARTVYDTPPAPLEDEWEYRHHPEDWLIWQTRYVTQTPLRNALSTGTPQQP